MDVFQIKTNTLYSKMKAILFVGTFYQEDVFFYNAQIYVFWFDYLSIDCNTNIETWESIC